MSENKQVVSSRGIGFFSLLGLLFIGLKLTGYINWSWWLVLLPLYGPITFLLGLVIVFCIFCLFMAMCAKIVDIIQKGGEEDA